MASFNIELNNKPETGTKDHALMLRITVDRKHARVKLIYSVKISQFNILAKNSGFVRPNHLNHKKINLYLEEKINDAKEIYIQLEKEHKHISAIAIKDLMQNPSAKSFSEYMWKHMESLKQNGQIGNYKKYLSTYNHLIDFTGTDKIGFHEIDAKFLSRFEKHLHDDGNVANTIAGYHRKLRAVFNMAISDKTINANENPYLNYKISLGVVSKDRLNMNSINKIAELDLPKDQKIWHVRNAFIFAFYAAGMRVSDVLMLKWENIEKGRLSYVMIKTKKQHSFTLPKQAITILNQYSGSNNTGFVFPFMTNSVNLDDPAILYDQIGAKTSLINKYLKEIATAAEIDSRVTSHTARHSFADIARTKVENLYNLSKTLGHSSLNVTENYLASFDEKAVDDTMDEIFN
jgi:site-specific recombinase XerD